MILKKLCFLILISSLISSKCENSLIEKKYSIKFVNKSNFAICPYFDRPYSNYLYPDTSSISNQKPYIVNITTGKYFYYDFGGKYEQVYQYAKSYTLSFFIFNTDTLNKYPWDTIRLNYMILQRYDLSLQDLQNRNFEIEYPYDSTRGKLKVYKK